MNGSRRLQATIQKSVLSEKLPSLPSFLQKLWVILNTQGFEHVICWDESGESFRIVDSQILCREVLPNFFKHNNLTSFVRQLNLYGFRKVSYTTNKNSFPESNENLHFANQYFIRGQYNQLHKIKRNAVGTKHRASGQSNPNNGSVKSTGKNVTLPEEDLICLLQELKIVRERQSTMKNTITQLTRDNILLWQEMAALRNSYLKQRDNVGKLVQFLMGLGQTHTQKRMPNQQRFVQLEEIDVNEGPVQLNVNIPQNNSNCLALQQNSSRFGTVDCDILDGIQQELSESYLTHNPVSLDVETSLLEGLQLRQRAIEEGGPYLDNGILSCDDQYQTVERPMSLRNEQRLQYYENALGLQLKRPIQRRVVSPASPVDFYPKRALYSASTQNQELVPTSSKHINRNSARIGNLTLNNESSPEPEDGIGYFLDEEADEHELVYDNEYQNEGFDEELFFMNELEEPEQVESNTDKST